LGRNTETRHRHARLKAPGIDNRLTNYTPVSNVTFMTKIVKRAVTKQLNQ